MSVYHPVFQGV